MCDEGNSLCVMTHRQALHPLLPVMSCESHFEKDVLQGRMLMLTDCRCCWGLVSFNGRPTGRAGLWSDLHAVQLYTQHTHLSCFGLQQQLPMQLFCCAMLLLLLLLFASHVHLLGNNPCWLLGLFSRWTGPCVLTSCCFSGWLLRSCPVCSSWLDLQQCWAPRWWPCVVVIKLEIFWLFWLC